MLRVSTKIKKQSKQVNLSLLNKLPRREEGRHFFRLFHANLTLVYLHLLKLCVPKAPNVQIQIGCHVLKELNCFLSCLSVILPFRPQALKWEQLRFALCVYQIKMVNSDVPHNSNLVSELHRNYLFKFKFCLQFDQTGTWWRCFANGLQTCSV